MGGICTSMTAGIGVLFLVRCWWTQGVLHGIRGHIRLPDDVMLPPTLGDDVLSNLNGDVLPNLRDPAFSTSCGLFVRIFRNCLMIAMCVALVLVAGGVVLLYCYNNSVTALTVLSGSEIVGIFQWVGLRQ